VLLVISSVGKLSPLFCAFFVQLVNLQSKVTFCLLLSFVCCSHVFGVRVKLKKALGYIAWCCMFGLSVP